MSEKQPNPSMTFRFSEDEISSMRSASDSWADSLRSALEKWSSDMEEGRAPDLSAEPDEKLKPYTLRMPDRLRSHIESTAIRANKTKAWVVRKVWSLYGPSSQR